jgi:hypothetical protein
VPDSQVGTLVSAAYTALRLDNMRANHLLALTPLNLTFDRLTQTYASDPRISRA